MNKPASQESSRLTIPNLITIGVFSAVYFLLVAVATFASAIIIPAASMIFLPAVSALISGAVYMLMSVKVGKFGGIWIMGLVMGVFFFVSGHFAVSALTGVIFGLLGDLIAKAGKYKNKKLLLLSYIVFSFDLTGPILPLWFMKDAYIANLEARGKDAEYINNLFSYVNSGMFIACVAAIILCGVLGGLFGEKMLKKHFEKAGIV